jgi:ABC-type lipoprotein release transport system permease subunit
VVAHDHGHVHAGRLTAWRDQLARVVAGAMGRAIFNMELSYQYDWSAVGVWLAIVFVISTLASILPARNATLISVRDSLSYA